MPHTCFIADLHLHPSRPAIIQLFIQFLEQIDRDTEALYILGDLFEAWIGDDDDAPCWVPVIDAIAAVSQRGIPVYLMHGNRDFLMGDTLASRCKATLLPEGHTLELYGKKTVLLHGDSLCTDDHAYQAFRQEVRDPVWQKAFLGKSLDERKTIARQLRETSQQANQEKADDIMDVNQAAVENCLREHGTLQMIHGHTHRPAIHRINLGGKSALRMVVGDWYEQGSCLVVDEQGGKLRVLTPR